jgi:hypothetical protein
MPELALKTDTLVLFFFVQFSLVKKTSGVSMQK